MKVKQFSLFILLCVSVLFVACDKNDQTELTFDKNSVEVIVNVTDTVKVSGGLAPYTTKEADNTIAKATVSSGKIAIKGLKKGQTTVTVTDADGITATIAVTVAEDPFEDEKDDATIRFKWDTLEKVKGTDAGTYLLSKANDKSVTFSWTSEDEEDSIIINFMDANDQIGEESETASVRESPAVAGQMKVMVDGETTSYNLISWRLVQAAPAAEDEPDTYWVAFTANGKAGLLVAPLAE
jgi:hypothetical protein